MANEVIVSVRLLDTRLNPLIGYPVMLLNPITDANPFGYTGAGYSQTVAWSGNTDGGGRVSWTGVQAGVYDIQSLNPSGVSNYTRNYAVQNSYVVADPVNQYGSQESRFAVRSGEHIQGVSNGIVARAFNNPQGTMYSQPYTWSRSSLIAGGNFTGTQMMPNFLNGTGNIYYQDPNAGTIFSVPNDNESKIGGLSYYHDNQNLYLFQKVDMVIA